LAAFVFASDVDSVFSEEERAELDSPVRASALRSGRVQGPVDAGTTDPERIRSDPVSTALKYTRFNDGEGSSHTLVVGLVPQGARVLEFGCATGYMSEVLKSRKGCTVTGIEISPEAAELAREHCARVIVGDAEELDYGELLGKERFEAILFADVLEHLKRPGEVLERIRPFLSRRGRVIASIPNIAHGSVRLALLAGEFRYRDLGLLDNTHLRFFTRDGIHDLFEGAGFVITNWLYTRTEIDGTEVRVPALPMSQPLREWLRKDPESSIYQFIVRAEASTAASQLATLRDEVKELRDLRESAAEADELKSTVEQQKAFIEGLRGRVNALTGQERETHHRLLETNRELLLRDQELFRLDADSRKKIQRQDEEVAELRHELNMLQSTKVWRAAGKYRQARDSISRLLRRT
jgi:2-polyprenyl-3-methyl-5-hydroxy-6-metoxy-1,4-benzoquinol methylase